MMLNKKRDIWKIASSTTPQIARQILFAIKVDNHALLRVLLWEGSLSSLRNAGHFWIYLPLFADAGWQL